MSFLLKTTTASSEPPSPSPDELQDKVIITQSCVPLIKSDIVIENVFLKATNDRSFCISLAVVGVACMVKIMQVRELVGSLSDEMMAGFLSDSTIRRFLRARNWSTQQATRALKETVRWRRHYRPERIRWDDIAEKEWEARRAYIPDYLDNTGRRVLISKPAIKAKASGKEQIKYFVYILESLAMNSADEQEHVTWLVDFRGWAISSTPLSITRESMHIVQNYYPGMMAVAILSNTPRIFESFWKIAKQFLDAKLNHKVKFLYTDKPDSHKMLLEMFDMDKLETAFGGRNTLAFDFDNYADRMRAADLARGASSLQTQIS